MKLLLVTTILLPLSALSFSLSPPLSASLLPARGTTVTTLTATVDDSSAFADYMVKSSEQKLKLEKQIADLKKQVDGVPTGAPGGATDSEMSAKIGDYETFISKYIVNAAAEKARAVKDAEEGARAKYKALLEQFAGGGGAGLELEPVGGVESAFERRNRAIADAGSMSRWGPAEIEVAKAAVSLRESLMKGLPQAKPVAAAPPPAATQGRKGVNFGATLIGDRPAASGNSGGSGSKQVINFGAALIAK